jgi:hypothetical protein
MAALARVPTGRCGQNSYLVKRNEEFPARTTAAELAPCGLRPEGSKRASSSRCQIKVAVQCLSISSSSLCSRNRQALRPNGPDTLRALPIQPTIMRFATRYQHRLMTGVLPSLFEVFGPAAGLDEEARVRVDILECVWPVASWPEHAGRGILCLRQAV